MSWPTNFAGLAGGNEPLSLFDAMFAQVAAMVPIPCTATGTNSIVLTPIGNAPSAANLGAYGSLNLFSFLASATSTGAVTAQFGALASLSVFKNDGATPATTGDLVIGHPYMLMFSQALSSGGGGFYLLRPAVTPSGGQATQSALLTFGTYTTPANCLQLRIRMIGGGGGGGNGLSVSGGSGSGTVFGAFSCAAGQGGIGGTAGGSAGGGGLGGTGGVGAAFVRLAGSSGGAGEAVSITGSVVMPGGAGAPGIFGMGAGSSGGGNAAGGTGAGGGAAVTGGSTASSGGGGGSGEYVEVVINNPVATYGFSAGTGGSGATGAGNGASGIILIEERYQD